MIGGTSGTTRAAVVSGLVTAAVVGGIAHAGVPLARDGHRRAPTAASALALEWASNTEQSGVVLGHLDGWTWQASCDLNLADDIASATLRAVPPAGVTYALESDRDLSGTETGENGEVPLTPITYVDAYPGQTAPSNPTDLEALVFGTKDSVERDFTAMTNFVVSNGHVETVSVRLVADTRTTVPAHEARCMIEGTITAAS